MAILTAAQVICYSSSSSFVVHMLCSVPQGSVLSPHLFIIYMADLADFVAERQLNFHSFADDTQTYLHKDSLGLSTRGLH